MNNWLRVIPMKISPSGIYTETWISKNPATGDEKNYKVNVRLGKPIDILSLKLNMVEDFANKVSYHRRTRKRLFETRQMEEVQNCPICGLSAKQSVLRLEIHGGQYHQCPECSHCFVIKRPNDIERDNFYRNDTNYASTYTDKRITETRVRQVAMPKAQWMVEQFELVYGKPPKSVLDVGAGGGHFVHACRELGIDAQGLELSAASRAFCKTNFGFELEESDFLGKSANFTGFDIITFWGLIEHVSNPMDFLEKANQAISGTNALIIVSVPRWNCFGTVVQTAFPDSVVRHLDPLGHLHCFTDFSLATAFENSRFVPVAAWYFGMDAYELVTQLSFQMEQNSVIYTLGKHIPAFQQSIDDARLSDEIIMAGKPVPSID